MKNDNIQYNVSSFRSAGLEAKWGRARNGAPFIFARDPEAKRPHQRETWWLVDGADFKRMQKVGIREGFNEATLLADVFSIPA